MHVVIVGPAWPHRGGIAHHTAALAEALVRAGHRVDVLGYRRLYPAWLYPGTSQHEPDRPPWSVEAEPIADPIRPDRLARLAARIRRLRPDRLVVQWWHPFFAATALSALGAARAAGAGTVLYAHNVLPHEPVPLAPALLRAVVALSDRVVVQSEGERSRLPVGGRGRARVVPHPPYDQFGGNAVEASRRPDDGALRVLFFGLVRPYKGLEDLLEAVALARGEGADVRLVVRGECYGEAERLHTRVERSDLRDAVSLGLHYVPEPEVGRLFGDADAVALPYRHATGSGVAGLALAFGRPIVGTQVPGLEAVVGGTEAAWLSAPGDVPGLAASLVAAWRCRVGAPAAWASREAAVRRAAGLHTWEAAAAAIVGE